METLDPYLHTVLGVQLAEPFYIQLRQSAELSDLRNDTDRLYPGMDMKLRLFRERRAVPEVTLGLQSAFGHKRMAGEYLAFSKRYHSFDFSGGLAWGRLGSAGHMSNPLKAVSSHFGKSRPLDGEMPNAPDDWFTGEDIGFFAGMNYETSFKGLSVNASWGADRYRAEKQAFDFDAPAPWTVGLGYEPWDWLSIGFGLAGGEKILGSLSFQSPFSRWSGRPYNKTYPKPLRSERRKKAKKYGIWKILKEEDTILFETAEDREIAWATLALHPHDSTPYLMGRAARRMANDAGPEVEALEITPAMYGLRGPAITLLRTDLERALLYGQSSPEELWRSASIGSKTARFDGANTGFIWSRLLNAKSPPFWHLNFALETQSSLSEEDSGLLYRTSFLSEVRKAVGKRSMIGSSLRSNLADNLDRLTQIRPRYVFPIRSDVDVFARKKVAVDRSYASWMTSLNTDLHFATVNGYLEEMYAGSGAEVLYRPFGKTFALGAEAWATKRRDPRTTLNLGLAGYGVISGYLNAWYEVPETNMTLQAKFGRYLAGDVGGTLSMKRSFRNGAKVEGFVTMTDRADFDLFGGTTHLYSGLRLSLPLGNVPFFTPAGSEVRLVSAPLGRDQGQILDNPFPLYDLTEPLSARHLKQRWGEILN